MRRCIARPLCDSWASCIRYSGCTRRQIKFCNLVEVLYCRWFFCGHILSDRGRGHRRRCLDGRQRYKQGTGSTRRLHYHQRTPLSTATRRLPATCTPAPPRTVYNARPVTTTLNHRANTTTSQSQKLAALVTKSYMSRTSSKVDCTRTNLFAEPQNNNACWISGWRWSCRFLYTIPLSVPVRELAIKCTDDSSVYESYTWTNRQISFLSKFDVRLSNICSCTKRNQNYRKRGSTRAKTRVQLIRKLAQNCMQRTLLSLIM